MDDEAFATWPAEDDEPQDNTDDHPSAGMPGQPASDEVEAEGPQEGEDTADEATTLASEASSGDVAAGPEVDEHAAVEPWTLPVRAAPILALQGENVVEFPLSQHVNGLESTSLVVDDKLMRIVEARYDPDGVRRLNVRMALVKEHISGYSHTHLDLFQKLQGVWWSSIGFGVLAATTVAQGLLALGSGAFVLAGIAGLLMAKLDLHRLSFSDHGGRHDFYLSGWRQEPYLIHNSTALLGPAFVEFLRTSELETEHIDAVIKTLGAPAKPAPELQVAPKQTTPAALPEPSAPAPLAVPAATTTPALPSPPPTHDVGLVPMTVSSGPPISNPPAPPTKPLPPPPAPVQHAPPPPSLPAASLPAPLPPAPLPPPMAPAPPTSNVDEDALWNDLS